LFFLKLIKQDLVLNPIFAPILSLVADGLPKNVLIELIILS